jgi:serine/threonine protein kinase/Tol biopolymer transport system component
VELPSGTRLGPYEILAPLGAGGMGEVHKARDTRLDRIVAIKVLPAPLAADPEFRQRFAREARAISALNDPHICTLFDVGETPAAGPDVLGVHYLVMEYLEGETLAARLARGPLSAPEAMQIGIEVATALETAHRNGIVHRDLKPGNVFLVKRSPSAIGPRAKLLDFGLAKTAHPVVSLTPHTRTATSPVTARGTILGTFQYMAPEQIEGADADARSDIFAFGALLYEMVTGRAAFHGATQASLFSSILRDQPPPIREQQPDTPAALEYLIRTCLAKDPGARAQSAHDLRLQLEWIATGSEPQAPAAKNRPPWTIVAASSAAALTAGGLIGALTWGTPRPDPSPRVTRFEQVLPEGQYFARTGARAVAVSPDGGTMLYHAGRSLYARRIDQFTAEPIAGTNEDPMEPLFSPDGASIAYFAKGGRVLRKVPLKGGSPVTLATLPERPSGASWDGGSIVFAATHQGRSSIYSVPDGGGEPSKLVDVDASVERLSHPRLIGASEHVLFTAKPPGAGVNDEGTISLYTLDSGRRSSLVHGGIGAQFLGGGELVYVHDGGLYAVRLDLDGGRVVGTPVLVAPDVPAQGGGQYAISASGTLVHQRAAPPPLRTAVWVDRKGREEPIAIEPRPYLDPRISPDGSRLAISADGDIWIWTFSRQVLTRFTQTKGSETNPIWTSDGRHLVFDSNEGSGRVIVRRAADGTGAAAVILGVPGGYPETLSPDGRYLVYHSAGQLPKARLLPLAGGAPAAPLVPAAGPAVQVYNAEISPNGRWIAYQSDESGRFEVFVHPFPALTSAQWQVSVDGGAHPAWARDGRELFYIDSAGVLVSVTIREAPGFGWDPAVPLFAAGSYSVETARNYDVDADGRRFLFIRNVSTAARPTLSVVVNWVTEARQKMQAAAR